MAFTDLEYGPIRTQWWAEIEGLRRRYGLPVPSWNPCGNWYWRADGSTSYLTRADDGTFETSGDFTAIVKVRPRAMYGSGSSKEQFLCGKWDSSSANCLWGLFTKGRKVIARAKDGILAGGITRETEVDNALTVGEWSTVALAYDDSAKNWELRVGGSGDDYTGVSGQKSYVTSRPFTIAAMSNGSADDRHFNGDVAWFAYWDLYRISNSYLDEIDAGTWNPRCKTTLNGSTVTPAAGYLLVLDSAVAATIDPETGSGAFTKAGTWTDSDDDNPAGTARFISGALNSVELGSQSIDPPNGSCNIPQHEIKIDDRDGEITELVSVSDTPWARTYLTGDIDDDDTTIPVEEIDALPAEGTLYLDRESIHVTGKEIDQRTGISCSIITGASASANGDTVRVYTTASATRINKTNYWRGAVITFTSGSNSGQSRTVSASLYNAATNQTTLALAQGLPNDSTSGDGFTLTYPLTSIASSTLTESDGYWNGAIVQFTSGPNSGVTSWVRSFDATNDRLDLAEPLHVACTTSSQFTIERKRLTGATRGAFGSEAKPHKPIDSDGQPVRRAVSNKVPVIRSRRVEIYEGRDGEAESQARRTVGYIDDYTFDNSGRTYSFGLSGLAKMLDRKILGKQKRSRVVELPVWGGDFVCDWYLVVGSSGNGGSFTSPNDPKYYFRYSDPDGKERLMQICRILFSEMDNPFEGPGNVKIGDEIIHYETVLAADWLAEFDDSFLIGDALYLANVTDPTEAQESLMLAQYALSTVSDRVAQGHLHNRGLFAQQIGADPVRRTHYLYPDTGDEYVFEINVDPLSRALMQYHEPGAEIAQVLMCSDSPQSDFLQYGRVEFSSKSGGNFVAGDTITGGTSGQTAVVVEADTTAAGDLLFVYDGTVNGGEFTPAESISCGGVSATADSVEPILRPRNNIVDAILQVMMSTGDTGSNGRYDTLSAGLGLGVDSDLIDVESFESLRDDLLGNIVVDFVIEEPIDFKEWFEKEIGVLAQVFLYENTDGKIALGHLMTRLEAVRYDRSNTVPSFDLSNQSPVVPGWASGRDQINKIQIRYNRRPGTGEYLSKAFVNFGDQAEILEGHGRKLQIKSGALYVPDAYFQGLSHRDPALPPLLRRFTSVLWDRLAKYPCPTIRISTTVAMGHVEVGSIVTVTHPTLPNLRTSARGLSGEYYQVVSKQRRNDGACEFELWQIGVHDNKFGFIVPSAKVVSYSDDGAGAGKGRVVVEPYWATADPWIAASVGKKDCDYFEVGDVITPYTSALVPLSTPVDEIAIEAIDSANNRIDLASNLGTNPSAGDVITWAKYSSCTTDQKNYGVFAADKDHGLGSTPDSAFKYL